MKDYSQYYKILGLEPGCSPAEIKNTYRKLAKYNHPDYNNNSQESILKTKEINIAYNNLKELIKEYYAALGLRVSADISMIRAAYSQKFEELTKNLNAGDATAQQKIDDITKIYQTLSNSIAAEAEQTKTEQW